MKVELRADERDGCTATITGCGIGGHTALFRFESPDYQVDAIKFDGDSVSYARDVLHGSVIARVIDDNTDDEAGELRATLEAFVADSDAPSRKSAKRAPEDSTAPVGAATGEHDPKRAAPRGAVTADVKEVVQEGDVAGDSQYEAAGEPRGEAAADVVEGDAGDVLADKGGDGKPNS